MKTSRNHVLGMSGFGESPNWESQSAGIRKLEAQRVAQIQIGREGGGRELNFIPFVLQEEP